MNFKEWWRNHGLILDCVRNCYENPVDVAYQAWKAAKQWQPIETAPKDGTVLLVCGQDGVRAIARYERSNPHFGNNGHWVSRMGHEENCTDALYWMPLPEPPHEA